MVQPVEVVIQGKDQASGALNSAGESASKMGDAVSNAAAKVAPALGEVISAVDAKTAAIKSGLQVEQSEIELQRQHLAGSQAEQQAGFRRPRPRVMMLPPLVRGMHWPRSRPTSSGWWHGPSVQKLQPPSRRLQLAVRNLPQSVRSPQRMHRNCRQPRTTRGPCG